MKHRINYIIKGQPTTFKKVSSAIGVIAVGLFIIGDFLYTPLKSLPLELQVFAIGELIPRIFFEFNTIVLLLFCMAMILYIFRWRSGTINLTEKQVIIEGQIGVSILIEKIKEINFFDSDYIIGSKRIAQIKTADDIFKLKFKTEDNYIDFAEKIVLTAGQYEYIKIESSVVNRPN